MIFPIGDTYPRKSFPIINVLLMLANMAVYLYLITLEDQQKAGSIVISYALKPDQLTDVKTLFTSMFLHGGPVHLLGNMLMLFVAGNSVEDRMGHLPYLALYLGAGLAGSLTHVVMAMTVLPGMISIPTVGASGAISGIVGAHLAALPGNKIKWILIFLPFWPAKVPAWFIIPLWVVMQVLMADAQLSGQAEGADAMIAVFAHLGGFALGFFVALWMRMAGKLKKPREAA